MKRMLDDISDEAKRYNNRYKSDIAFVGSMYNEKHNLFERLSGVNDFTKGYLDAVMNAQRKVYGYFFLEQLLKGEVLNDMLKNYPVETSRDGVETVQYLYADYFLARKMAADDRKEILGRLGKEFGREYAVNLYTPNETPDIAGVNNCRYYLKHDSERQQIARNGYEKIEQNHTYDVRFKEIFNTVFN